MRGEWAGRPKEEDEPCLASGLTEDWHDMSRSPKNSKGGGKEQPFLVASSEWSILNQQSLQNLGVWGRLAIKSCSKDSHCSCLVRGCHQTLPW